MGGVTSNLFQQSVHCCDQISKVEAMANLVAKTLGGNDGDFIAKTLVGLEVERQLRVVTLNDDLGGLLDGLLIPSAAGLEILFRNLVWAGAGLAPGYLLT